MPNFVLEWKSKAGSFWNVRHKGNEYFLTKMKEKLEKDYKQFEFRVRELD